MASQEAESNGDRDAGHTTRIHTPDVNAGKNNTIENGVIIGCIGCLKIVAPP
jgi:hypothetical protein